VCQQTRSPKSVAIVGGGPAGAFAAAELARAGRDVWLFEEKLAWEKPCGGGITPKAVERWPFLRDARVERRWVDRCELIAPSGRKVRFHLDREIAIFSRTVLNGLMLEKVREAGAEVRAERVLTIVRDGESWSLQTSSAIYRADFLVLASGARNPFRSQFSQALGPENCTVAVSYYIPGCGETMKMKF